MKSENRSTRRIGPIATEKVVVLAQKLLAGDNLYISIRFYCTGV